MRTRLQTLVAVMAVASAILMLGYTAVVPRALVTVTDEIPAYAESL